MGELTVPLRGSLAVAAGLVTKAQLTARRLTALRAPSSTAALFGACSESSLVEFGDNSAAG